MAPPSPCTALSPALGTLGDTCQPTQHGPRTENTQARHCPLRWGHLGAALGTTCHLAWHHPLHWGHPGTALSPLSPCMALSPAPGRPRSSTWHCPLGTAGHPCYPVQHESLHWEHTGVPVTSHGTVPCTGDTQVQRDTSTAGPPAPGMPVHGTAAAQPLAQPQHTPQRGTAGPLPNWPRPAPCCAAPPSIRAPSVQPLCPQCHRGKSLPVAGARCGTCLAAAAQLGPAPGCRRGCSEVPYPVPWCQDGATEQIWVAVLGPAQPGGAGVSVDAHGPGQGGFQGCQHPPGCHVPAAALAPSQEKVQSTDVPAPGNPRS